jgi:hypothetical protein
MKLFYILFAVTHRETSRPLGNECSKLLEVSNQSLPLQQGQRISGSSQPTSRKRKLWRLNDRVLNPECTSSLHPLFQSYISCISTSIVAFRTSLAISISCAYRLSKTQAFFPLRISLGNAYKWCKAFTASHNVVCPWNTQRIRIIEVLGCIWIPRQNIDLQEISDKALKLPFQRPRVEILHNCPTLLSQTRKEKSIAKLFRLVFWYRANVLVWGHPIVSRGVV